MIPESENDKATSSILSKSLTTSLINATSSEKIIDNTSMDEVISNFTSSVNNSIAEPKLITDVLETIVGTMSGFGVCSIVAGDQKYRYGTIVRVQNSKIGTFNAIVLDRGSDIGIGRRYMFDLLFWTEKESYDFGLSRNTTFEILRYGY